MNDTICALATAPGGALGIIRVSGTSSFTIINQICNSDITQLQPNTTHYTKIYNKQGEILDEVILSIFHGPRSYTGEDSVEISCHGSSYILNNVLDLLIQHGCRMANPGE